MEVLPSNLSPTDAQFKTNAAHHRELAAQLRERLETVRAGGGEKYRATHESRGKLFVRDRIDRLLDPGSPFLELAPLTAWEMYDGRAHSAGIVTGIAMYTYLLLAGRRPDPPSADRI